MFSYAGWLKTTVITVMQACAIKSVLAVITSIHLNRMLSAINVVKTLNVSMRLLLNHTHNHAHTRTHTHTHTRTLYNTHTHTLTHRHTPKLAIHTHTQCHAHVHAYTHTLTCTHEHTHTYEYICMHTNTTHTHRINIVELSYNDFVNCRYANCNDIANDQTHEGNFCF